MKLQLNNIGPFKNTSLKISDVTVIAGANDTGKSYLNKLLFSAMKIINIDIENTLFENFVKEIEELFSSLSFRLRNENQNSEALKQELKHLISIKNQELETIRENKHIFDEFLNSCLSFLSKINVNLKNMSKLSEDELDKNIKLKENRKLHNNKRKLEKNIYSRNYRVSNILENALIKINKIAFDLKSIKEIGRDNAYFQLSKSIFDINFKNENIKNKNYLEENSSLILFDENNSEILNFDVDKEILNTNKNLNIYNDITYISDTFEMFKFIARSKRNDDFDNDFYFFNQSNNISSISKFKNIDFDGDFKLKIQPKNEVVLTEIDLKKKLESKFKEYLDLPYEVNKTYDGFIINKKQEEVKFSNSSKGLRIIKSFNELINTNIFNKDNILIIDEPEAFIHPERQYYFIKWILDVTYEIKPFKLVISTHSPYIIEILESMFTRKFSSEKSKLEFSFNFLDKDKSENYDVIIEQEPYPDKINSKLNIPFNQLEKDEEEWDIENAN